MTTTGPPQSERDATQGAKTVALWERTASPGGAIIGGLAGMRFHRKVDRTG